jgi:hypothetical protein
VNAKTLELLKRRLRLDWYNPYFSIQVFVLAEREEVCCGLDFLLPFLSRKKEDRRLIETQKPLTLTSLTKQ